MNYTTPMHHVAIVKSNHLNLISVISVSIAATHDRTINFDFLNKASETIMTSKNYESTKIKI